MVIQERRISEIPTATEEGSVSPPVGDIYCITSPSGNRYIGQTIYSMEERFSGHRAEDTATRGCKALGGAGTKYGWENMTLKLIEKCPREKLNEREIYWISHYDTFHNGYNCTIGGAGVSKFWLPFEEARAFARSLNLSSKTEWAVWSKSGTRPADIPGDPAKVFKDQGWVGYGDWLGTGNNEGGQAKQWRSFAEARAWARGLGLSNQSAWQRYRQQRPADIPSTPEVVYKDQGWAGYGDWLGTGRRSRRRRRQWRSFAAVRTFARSLNIKKEYRWVKYWKTHEKPSDIPSHPDRTYKGKWVSWKDFLGN